MRRLGALMSALLLISALPSQAVVSERILAVVNGEAITSSDYRRFVLGMGNMGKGGIEDGVNENFLNKMIEERLMVHEAGLRGIFVTDAETEGIIEEFRQDNGLSQEGLENEVAKTGLDLQGFKKLMKEKIATRKLISFEVDSKVVVTDREVEAFYDSHRKDFLISPEKVQVGAIFLRLDRDVSVTELTDLKRKALRIVSELKEGGNFDILAERYSDAATGGRKGVLGEFAAGSLIRPLDSKVFSMKKGEVSDPIWVKDGAYILKVISRTEESFRPLEEVGAGIKEYLGKEKRERLFRDWVRRLWEKAAITVN